MNERAPNHAAPYDVASAERDAAAETTVAGRLVTYAERLVPRTARVRGRVATLTTRAVTVRERIDVDVVHEELVITYADGDGAPMPRAEAVEHRILLRAEEVVVTKRVRVVEEVVVTTKPAVTLEPFSETVAREVLTIDGEPAP